MLYKDREYQFAISAEVQISPEIREWQRTLFERTEHFLEEIREVETLDQHQTAERVAETIGQLERGYRADPTRGPEIIEKLVGEVFSKGPIFVPFYSRLQAFETVCRIAIDLEKKGAEVVFTPKAAEIIQLTLRTEPDPNYVPFVFGVALIALRRDYGADSLPYRSFRQDLLSRLPNDETRFVYEAAAHLLSSGVGDLKLKEAVIAGSLEDEVEAPLIGEKIPHYVVSLPEGRLPRLRNEREALFGLGVPKARADLRIQRPLKVYFGKVIRIFGRLEDGKEIERYRRLDYPRRRFTLLELSTLKPLELKRAYEVGAKAPVVDAISYKIALRVARAFWNAEVSLSDIKKTEDVEEAVRSLARRWILGARVHRRGPKPTRFYRQYIEWSLEEYNQKEGHQIPFDSIADFLEANILRLVLDYSGGFVYVRDEREVALYTKEVIFEQMPDKLRKLYAEWAKQIGRDYVVRTEDLSTSRSEAFEIRTETIGRKQLLPESMKGEDEDSEDGGEERKD